MVVLVYNNIIIIIQWFLLLNNILSFSIVAMHSTMSPSPSTILSSASIPITLFWHDHISISTTTASVGMTMSSVGPLGLLHCHREIIQTFSYLICSVKAFLSFVILCKSTTEINASDINEVSINLHILMIIMCTCTKKVSKHV